jgi:hypothetical protein
MFRCHFTRLGHIVMGENLAAITLEDAIAEGQKLLAQRSQEHELDGIEIWDGVNLLHSADAASGIAF